MFTETKGFKAYCRIRKSSGLGKASDFVELGNYLMICCLEPDYMLQEFEKEYNKTFGKERA